MPYYWFLLPLSATTQTNCGLCFESASVFLARSYGLEKNHFLQSYSWSLCLIPKGLQNHSTAHSIMTNLAAKHTEARWDGEQLLLVRDQLFVYLPFFNCTRGVANSYEVTKPLIPRTIGTLCINTYFLFWFSVQFLGRFSAFCDTFYLIKCSSYLLITQMLLLLIILIYNYILFRAI